MGKSFKKRVKKIGRTAQKVAAKAVKVVTPVLAGAATLFVGPAGGAAITAAGMGIARVTGATAARDKGYSGRHARDKGRNLAKRVGKYGAIATGLGVGASLVAGGSALTGIAGTLGSASSASSLGKVAPKAGSFTDMGPSSDLAGPDYNALASDAMGQYSAAGGQNAFGSGPGLNNPRPITAPTPGAVGPSGFGGLTAGVTSILGTMAGGVLDDKGDRGSGSPGESTTSDATWNPFDGERKLAETLKNPLVVAALVVAGVMLVQRMG